MAFSQFFLRIKREGEDFTCRMDLIRLTIEIEITQIWSYQRSEWNWIVFNFEEEEKEEEKEEKDRYWKELSEVEKLH